MHDCLEAISQLDHVRHGILRITADSESGLIGIFCGRYITGAVLKESRQTGHAALQKLLSLQNGSFAYLDAAQEVLPDVRQALSVDIQVILSCRKTFTEETLTGLLTSNDQLVTIDTNSDIAPGSEGEKFPRISRTYDRLVSLSRQRQIAQQSAAAGIGAQQIVHLTDLLDTIFTSNHEASHDRECYPALQPAEYERDKAIAPGEAQLEIEQKLVQPSPESSSCAAEPASDRLRYGADQGPKPALVDAAGQENGQLNSPKTSPAWSMSADSFEENRALKTEDLSDSASADALSTARALNFRRIKHWSTHPDGSLAMWTLFALIVLAIAIFQIVLTAKH